MFLLCFSDINECTSNPCAYGSTCIDGIGEFRCICPPGRTGDRCQTVIGSKPRPLSCTFMRRIYEDQSSWQHECNSCSCNNGEVTCSKVSLKTFTLNSFIPQHLQSHFWFIFISLISMKCFKQISVNLFMPLVPLKSYWLDP